MAVWVVAVVLGGAAALAFLAAPLPRAIPVAFHLPWPALAAAWVAADLAVVAFEFRRQAWSVNLAEVPLVVGLVFTGPAHLLPARLIATAAVFVLYRRQAAYKAAYNIALNALETVVALRIYFAVLGTASPVSRLGWVAAFAAIFAANLVSHLGIMTAIAITNGRPRADDLRVPAVTALLVTFINTCLSLITVCVLWIDPLGGALLVAVCVVLGLGYRSYQSLRQRQTVLERIYDFTQAVDGHHDLQGVVGASLGAARETMAAEVAEIYLRQPTGWVHYRLDDDGLAVRTTDEPGSLERLAMGDGKGILVPRGGSIGDLASFELAERSVTDAIAVPLAGADLEGSITVIDRQGDVFTFVPGDLRALTSMASHAAVAIHSAVLLERLGREVEEKQYQALHDSLTGLPNRAMFAAKVEEAIAVQGADGGTGAAAVMLVDLDGFKEVNDTLGHGVGDVVLRATAARVRLEIGRRGTVARLGGDEFGVIIPVRNTTEAVTAAEEVKRAIEQPIEEDELLIEVRASVGVAIYPEHGETSATLLRLADVAMYAAKEHRAGVIAYESRYDHYSPRRLALAGELRRALAAHDLTLAYQPQQDLRTGAITAVEALVRWSHPKHGMVPPDEFIPVAEQTGLIVPLTDYVLTEALAQQARWRSRGYDLNMAVNLSPRVVQDGQLPALVSRRLVQAGVLADRLTLELTETGLVTDHARVAAILNQLATMGVRTSIDDFGTGYSSLSRLSDLPVAEVKIDKSFVFAMADGGAETVVRSIVDLGHNLNLRVVAEGVEDLHTLDRLRELRCHAIQGHVLSRAVPGPVLEAWLATRLVEADSSRVIVPMRKPRAEPGRLG